MIAADDDVRAAVDAARAGGFMLGVLVIVVLLQLVTFVMTRESSIPWYVGLVACLAAIALTMDGVSPFPPGAPALLCLDLAAMICAAGFVVAYLRLWSQARALFWAVAASCGASIAVGIVGVIVSGLRTQAESLRVPLVCAFCVAMFAVIVIRARRFTPAWILLGGTSLLIASSTYRALRAHIGVPFLDRWAFDIGATLDAIIFASAIVARVRYAISDRRAIERRLTEATYEASHDPLTGALNRRGLFASTSLSRGTLVAVDLDGFKAVNDRYGHGAGDAVLKDVTAALRGVVPSGLVARIGGDEFVLVTGEDDQRSGEMLATAIADAVANVRCAGLSNHDGIAITASVGCASLDGRSLEAALRIADASAYLMKAMRRAEAS
jgi:diguanylate cyclase (GGDEF)-like protein